MLHSLQLAFSVENDESPLSPARYQGAQGGFETLAAPFASVGKAKDSGCGII